MPSAAFPSGAVAHCRPQQPKQPLRIHRMWRRKIACKYLSMKVLYGFNFHGKLPIKFYKKIRWCSIAIFLLLQESILLGSPGPSWAVGPIHQICWCLFQPFFGKKMWHATSHSSMVGTSSDESDVLFLYICLHVYVCIYIRTYIHTYVYIYMYTYI